MPVSSALKVVGHGVAVTGVGGVLVRAVEVAGGGQTEAAAGAGREDHRPGTYGDEPPRAGVEARGTHRTPLRREDPYRHHPVLDADALAHLAAPQLPVEDLLDVLALGHRQHVRAGAMHLADRVLTVLVLLELHAVRLQAPHHREAAGRGLADGGLVDDAVVGAGDLGDVVVGFGAAGDDRVVDAVHAHGERAGVADVGLLQEEDVGPVLGGGEGRHRLKLCRRR